MRQRVERQAQLIQDLRSTVAQSGIEEYLSNHEVRSSSSVEEALVSLLPLMDDRERNETLAEFRKVRGPAESGVVRIDEAVLSLLRTSHAELANRVKTIALTNLQNRIQSQFYDRAGGILSLSRAYEFPARYEAVTPKSLSGESYCAVEAFNYGGSQTYRSMLYHLMRHLSNITGNETDSELYHLAEMAFSGKRVLELGSGPGFFLDTLRQLGARVVGVEKNEQHSQRAQSAGLDIRYGDARDVRSLMGANKYDIILSKDFLSLSVTGEHAECIMKGVFDVSAKGALHVHQVDYGKHSEEEYLSKISRLPDSEHIDPDNVLRTWSKLDDEEKDYLLRKNILNISLEDLAQIGFQPYTSYRIDLDGFLTVTSARV